jgi:hypothetical protein
MRWTAHSIAITFGLFVLAANIQPVAAQQRDNGEKGRQGRRPIYEEHDAVTNTVLSSTVNEQGVAIFTAKAGDFTLEKAVASTGDTTIRLMQGKDVVSIAMNHGGYVVARGKKTARLDSQSEKQEDMDAVRAVLLGSPAVRTFRRLSASLENRDDDDHEGPLFLSTLVDGAIVQMLDGDSGATERIGKRITRKRRASLRPAMLRADGLFTDCILNYEMSLMQAWDLFSQCTQTALNSAWYIWWSAEKFCELEFLIRSQQYVYQFIGCLAYPF